MRSLPIYYGWIVVAVAFAIIMVTAGVRSTPALFIRPFEDEFGWDRAGIALAVSINLLLFGLVAPVAGRLIDRYGSRLVVLGSLPLLGAGVVGTLFMREIWQLHLLWGVVVGVGSGAGGSMLSATVAARWFSTRRGLVTGILGAATSAGQLVWFPLLMTLIVTDGWRGASLAVVIALLALIPIAYFLMKDEPEEAMGPAGRMPPPPERAVPVSHAAGTMDFWLLATSMFVCGATTQGLIGTHLIPHSLDHGIPEVGAAGAIGVMGMMNFVGTALSGWLTDRWDKRKLLAAYYFFRGVSLFLLPWVSDFSGLAIFAVIYGLDWFATLPPTVGLIADRFGRRSVGGVYGWVFLSHQVGSAAAAYLAGAVRVWMGDYGLAFLAAGTLAVVAAGLSLRVSREPALVATPAPAG